MKRRKHTKMIPNAMLMVQIKSKLEMKYNQDFKLTIKIYLLLHLHLPKLAHAH